MNSIVGCDRSGYSPSSSVPPEVYKQHEDKQRVQKVAKRAHYRNLFVAAMSAAVFVTHASSASKTEAFYKEILSLQYI